MLLTLRLPPVWSYTAVGVLHILLHEFELKNINLIYDRNSIFNVAGCELAQFLCSNLSLLSLTFFFFFH